MKKALIIVFSVFFAIVLVYGINNYFQTESFFSYILDDAYIHLAIAKNFALYGNWGITKYVFSSTSSSPLFTLILSALISVFGDYHLIPFWFNLLLFVFIIVFLGKHFSRYFSSQKLVIFSILFALFSSVLYVQIFSGMEHILQVLVLVVNIFYFQKWIDSNYHDEDSRFWFFFTITIMGLIRFESMFYLTAVIFVFLLLKKFKKSAAVLLVGFLPIVAFCFYNYQNTGYLFPFSVVVKGSQFSFQDDFSEQLYRFVFNNFLLNRAFYKIGFFPLVIFLAFFIKDFKLKGIRYALENNLAALVISITMVFHTFFADLKGFFRYESYLMVGFAMTLLPRLVDYIKDNFFQKLKKLDVVCWSSIFIILITIYKIGFSHIMLWYGGKNIYEQQIQSAKFLEKYYPNSKIVANDIGAICYFTEIQLFDIVGLGSQVTVPYNENNRPRDLEFGDFVKNYTAKNNYEVAIIYDNWLKPYIPSTWKKVAKLQITHNWSCAYDHVFVYAVDSKDYNKIIGHIKNFTWNKNVKVEIVR